MKPEHHAASITILCNGLALQALRRPLEQGDYLQFVPYSYRGGVTVTAATFFLHLMPALRLWTLPIAFPPLTHVRGEQPAAVLANAARAFQRFFRGLAVNRQGFLRQLDQEGAWPVWVLSARRPPLVFAMPSRVCPTLEEAEPFLRSTGAIPDDETLWTGRRYINLLGAIFVAVRQDDPLPDALEFSHVVAISRNAPTALHFFQVLPHTPHTVAAPPLDRTGRADMAHGAAFALLTPPAAAAAENNGRRQRSRPTSAGSASMSLLQTRVRLHHGPGTGTALVQVRHPGTLGSDRCKGLGQARIDEGCSCTNNQVFCTTAAADASASMSQVGPGRTTKPGVSVATPFGRRAMPAPSRERPNTGVKVLNLCALLADTGTPCQEATLTFPVPTELPRDLFQVFDPDCLCRDMPDGLQLHPTAKRLLHGLPWTSEIRQASAVQIYIDGSFQQGVGSWAIACFGCVDGSWAWAGFLADLVPADIQTRSAFEAELFAQLVAKCLTVHFTCPVGIGYDAESAALIAQGASAGAAGSALAAASTAIEGFLRLRGREPLRLHVRAHTGHPANELVDSLAKAAVHTPAVRRASHIHSVIASLLQRDFDWMWVRAPGVAGHVLPPLDEFGVSHPIPVRAEALTVNTPACWEPHTRTDTVRQAPVPCQFRLCTYNTLSAIQAVQRKCLAQAMQNFRIDVMALQETRTCPAPVEHTQGVLRLASPAVDGQEGCQLWLRTGGTDGWDPLSVAISFARPRLLVVFADWGNAKYAFFVGHACTSVTSEQAIEEFWDLCRARLLALPSGRSPVLMFDCNARFDIKGEDLSPMQSFFGTFAATSACATPVSLTILARRCARGYHHMVTMSALII